MAYDKVLLEHIAIKVQPVVDPRSYYKNAHNLLMKIGHENIIGVRHIEYEQNVCYVIMDLANDGDLLALISKKERLAEGICRNIFRQIVNALAASHAHGLYHSDIKPENILLNGSKVFLSDWCCTVSHTTNIGSDSGTTTINTSGSNFSSSDTLGRIATPVSLSERCNVPTRCRSDSILSINSDSDVSQGYSIGMGMSDGGRNSRFYSSCHNSPISDTLSPMKMIMNINESRDWTESNDMFGQYACYSAPEWSWNQEKDFSKAFLSMYESISPRGEMDKVPYRNSTLEALDIWSLGITLFVMSAGYTPSFSPKSTEDLTCCLECPSYFSPSLKHLLVRMLDFDPTKRYTMSDILCHKWVTICGDKAESESRREKKKHIIKPMRLRRSHSSSKSLWLPPCITAHKGRQITNLKFPTYTFSRHISGAVESS
jgi:serine/threonine protein kinase